MADEWYYMASRKQLGPVPLARIRELLAIGVLTESDEIWRAGTPDWLAIRVVPELQNLIPDRPGAVRPVAGPPEEPGLADPPPAVFIHHPPTPLSWAVSIPLRLALAAGGGWLGYLFLSSLGAFVGGGWLLALGGAVYALVILLGIAFSCWRTAFEIDSNRRIVTLRQGPFWPLFESRYPAADFYRVGISRQVRAWRRGGAISGTTRTEVTYALELQGATRLVRLASGDDSHAIRYLAEDVGRFLQLDVIDATEDPPVVRKAKTLGLTLQQASQSKEPPGSGRTIQFALPPAAMTLDYEIAGDRAVFRFPQKGYGCLAAWLPFAAAGAAFVAYVAVQSGSALLIAIWTGVVGLPLLLGFAVAVPTRITVEADRREIQVTTTAFGVPSRRQVATDRVREVRRTYKAIHVEAREGSVAFGCRGLTEEQVEWVRDVLVRIVAA